MPRLNQSNPGTNPLNYSQIEAQLAKRVKRDAPALKALFRQCWAASDTYNAFANALREHGLVLVRGDLRGFAAVDVTGETYSLSRWCGGKPKDSGRVWVIPRTYQTSKMRWRCWRLGNPP